MRASSILRRSSVAHADDAPFSAEHVQVPPGDGGGGRGGRAHRGGVDDVGVGVGVDVDAAGDRHLRGHLLRPPRTGHVVIDRRSAWDASVLHGRWISRMVSDVCRSRRDGDGDGGGAAGGDDDLDDGGELDRDDDDAVVVVAYLTGNSPDVMLSLLGCMEVAADYNDGDESSSPSPSSSSPGTDATTTAGGGMRGGRRRILPAMLNARWTPGEIAAALGVSPPTTATATEGFIGDGDGDGDGADGGAGRGAAAGDGVSMTLILHGPGFERAAHEAADLLRTPPDDDDGPDRRLRHVVRALPLPAFGSAAAAAALGDDGGGTDPIPIPPSRMHDSSGEDPRLPLDNNTVYMDGSDDDAIILFTSGTSSSRGTARGVRLSHRSLLVQAGAKLGRPCRYDSDTRMVATTVPFFHVGGLSSALAVVAAGGTLVFPPPPPARPRKEGGGGGGAVGFNAGRVLSVLSSPPSRFDALAANTLVVVPAMIHGMLELIEKYDASNSASASSSSSSLSPVAVESSYPNVRLVLVGGQSASPAQLSRARRAFPNAAFVQTYACTEAGSSITFSELTTGHDDDDDDDDDGDQVSGGGAPSGTGRASPPSESADAVSRRYGGDCVGVPPPHIEVGIFRMGSEGEGAEGGADPAARPPAPGGGPNGPTTDDRRPLDTGLVSGPFEVGLIGTRGPHVMNGYWRRGGGDRDGAAALPPSRVGGRGLGGRAGENGGGGFGWLRTNDVGYLDDAGRLYFCGRAGDVVRTGGETVFAPEVERVLSRHDAVECCAVFAVPDERLGETVAVAVVLVNSRRSGMDGDDGAARGRENGLAVPIANEDVVASDLRGDFRRLCARHHLSGYKWPRKVFTLHELPRNSTGKVLKHRLKEMFTARPSRSRSTVANRSYL